MKTIEVVAAMIQVEDMILVVQRKEDEKAYKSLKWEFPGGKVEEGERPEDAVIREVKEELQLDINPVALWFTNTPIVQLILRFFIAPLLMVFLY